MVGASLFAMFFFITLYMQQVLGYSPIKAGLSYLPLSVAIMLSAGVASQLVTKIGFKPVMAAGLALVAAGLVWFSQISVDGGFTTDILGPSLLAAIGLGFAFVTTTIAAVSGIEDREQGLASGLINTSQQIGGALGLADPGDAGQHAHRRRARRVRRRPRRAAERAGRGLPDRLPGRRADRAARAWPSRSC